MKAGGNIDFKKLAREVNLPYKTRTAEVLEKLYDKFDDDVNPEKFDPAFEEVIRQADGAYDGQELLAYLRAVLSGTDNEATKALAKAHEDASKPVVVAVDQSDPEYKKAEAICTVSNPALMDACNAALKREAPGIVSKPEPAAKSRSWNELRVKLMLQTGHIPEEGLSDVAKEELRELNRLAESDIIRDAGNQYVRLSAKEFKEKIITRSEGSVEELDNILRNPSEPFMVGQMVRRIVKVPVMDSENKPLLDPKTKKPILKDEEREIDETVVDPFLVHYQEEGKENAEEVSNYFDAKEALRHRYGIPRNSFEIQWSVTGIDGVSPGGGSSAKDDLSGLVNGELAYRRNTFFVSENGWLSVGAGLRFSEIKPRGASIREDEPTHFILAGGLKLAYNYAVSHPLAVFAGADLFLNKPTGSYLQGDGVMRSSRHLSSDLVVGLVVRDFLSGVKDAPSLDLVLSGGWRARYNPLKIKEENFTTDERATDPTLSEKQGYLTGGAAVGSAALRWNFGK